jgi:NAD(P)H-nitrite reductase large subunit
MEDKKICFCKKVNLSTIEEAIANGADTVEKVKEATGAGSGCGRCKATIQKILDEKK